MKKTWVISLGGSRIIPNDVDYVFLRKFKILLNKHKDKKFVVVCGGGSSARRYIYAFRKLKKSLKDQSKEGIAITRFHAGFMARFFGRGANKVVPTNMKKVKRLLSKNRIIFCGAMRWRNNNTSDGNAAQLAGYLETPFINLTNVRGLYNSNPKINKKAKFIENISWKDFLKIARKIKYKAGQHFVLDLVAAEEILKRKIVTYIVGSLKNVDLVLKDKKRFGGTLISG
jgi:predicted uridylate kinase